MEKLIQISSGRGPRECCLAVQNVFHKMQVEAGILTIKLTLIEQDFQDSLPSSILLKVEGSDLDQFLKRWVGTIQWICQSPFRSKHPRKNWFVGINLIEGPESEKELFERDVQFQTMRSSGAGGQHVNKVSSAVRATHLPTGISIQVMDSRSQLQNKQIALQRLKQQLSMANENNVSVFRKDKWIEQINIIRGNPVLIFEGEKFKEKK